MIDGEGKKIQLTDETIKHIEERITVITSLAVTSALNQVLAPERVEAFWMMGFSLVQKNAKEIGGNLVFGSIKSLFKSIGTFLVIGGLVYAVGGWGALAALWKVLFMKVSDEI